MTQKPAQPANTPARSVCFCSRCIADRARLRVVVVKWTSTSTLGGYHGHVCEDERLTTGETVQGRGR